MKKLLLILLLIVSSLNVFGNVDIDANSLINNRKNWFYANVVGESMRMYYPHQSTVIIKPIDFSSVKVGQVVAYKNNFGDEVVHRVEKKVDGGFLMKGSNNKGLDSTVLTDKNILGVVYVTFNEKSNTSRTLLACVEK